MNKSEVISPLDISSLRNRSISESKVYSITEVHTKYKTSESLLHIGTNMQKVNHYSTNKYIRN